MADIHIRVSDELKRVLKITAAKRGETITDAMRRMAWWYADGTDELMLDGLEEALGAAQAAWRGVNNHPSASEAEDVEFYDSILDRVAMDHDAIADAAQEEG